MSGFSPLSDIHDDFADPPQHDGAARRRWVAPKLAPHSTLTTLTQVPLPQPLSLLFLQSSRQCFDQDGTPVACPP